MDKMNYEEFEGKLGSWAPRFRPFIESKGMWDIYQRLKKDAFEEREVNGKVVWVRKERIVPDSEQTFRAFSTTDRSNVKVIFYLMDPYPRLYKGGLAQATGIAMDCSNSPDGKIQPSLEKWYDVIDETYDTKVERSGNLEYLHQQGVMLLNTDLTCKLNKTGSHKGVWKDFQKYFLQEVMDGTTGIIYVLCGDTSLQMEKYINNLGNYIFKVEHPAASAHSNTSWKHKDIFKKIDKILKDNNNTKIMWDKKEWQSYSDPPF